MPTPLPVPTFIFPIANPHVLHLNTLAMDVPINCTITWEGDLSQLTTTWSYNGTMITNSQKYLITEGNLVIRQFMAQDIGTYECTVKHSSGWNDSRQYFININEGKYQCCVNKYVVHKLMLRCKYYKTIRKRGNIFKGSPNSRNNSSSRRSFSFTHLFRDNYLFHNML